MQDLTPFSKNSQFPPQDFPSVYRGHIINFSKTKNVNIFLAIKEFRRRILIVCFVIVLCIIDCQ